MSPKITIVGSGKFIHLADQVLKELELPYWIDIEVVDYPLMKLLESNVLPGKNQKLFGPARIVISGEQSSSTLEKAFQVITIPVKISYAKILLSMRNGQKNKKVAIINYKTTAENIDTIAKQFGINIIQYRYSTLEELRDIFTEIKKKGISKVIGGSIACQAAANHELQYEFFYSKDTLKHSLETAIKYLEIYRDEMEKSALFNTIFSITEKSVLIVDENFRVTEVSNSAESLLGIERDISLGKSVNEIIPSLNLSNKVVQSERSIFEWNNKKFVVERSPVNVSDEKIGEMLVISDIDKIQTEELSIRSMMNEKPLRSQYDFSDIIGSSEDLQHVKDIAKKYSQVDMSVLIQGESGTGKELFAQSIHSASLRNKGPFVAVNCAALPESLIESELFGYEEGAFSGATKGGKKGLFELADKGTIFLDEISELPLHLQSRLLRVLEEKEVMRVGGNKIIPIDTRVITASNKSLIEAVNKNKFRSDLYYRISVLQLEIPPLRKRKQDIEDVVRHYLKKLNLDENLILTKEALDILKGYTYPGNVRELRNVIERLKVLLFGVELNKKVIKELIQAAISPTSHSELQTHELVNTLNLKAAERQLIEKALEKHKGNRAEAAKDLGISRATLWRKLNEET